MSRLFALFQQFGDDNLQSLSSGTLKFTLNGVTSTDQNTFSDVLLTKANPNPVTLDGEGRLPFDVWGSGVYSVILKDKNGVLIRQLDDVSSGAGVGSGFGVWSDAIVYNIPSFVVGSNGLYYRTLSNGNLNNDPILNPGTNLFWEEFKLRGVWNSSIAYAINDVVQTTAGNLWKALTATAANNPETDDGTNWVPAINGAKVPEIITLETRSTTVIPQTTSGTLTALRNNELQDGGAFDLPLASSVSVNQTINISQPDAFVSFTPVVSRAGSDTITDSEGTDTSITFDNTQSLEIILTSDGVSDWRL